MQYKLLLLWNDNKYLMVVVQSKTFFGINYRF